MDEDRIFRTREMPLEEFMKELREMEYGLSLNEMRARKYWADWLVREGGMNLRRMSRIIDKYIKIQLMVDHAFVNLEMCSSDDERKGMETILQMLETIIKM